MARIRTIKPGFFLNEQLAELPYEWRLLFIGLWTQADRAGRFEDRPKRLKAALFPYDDLDIHEGLGCLVNAGLLVRYETEDGRRLMAIPTWEKHQQPHIKEQPSELPDPKDGTCTVLAPCKPVGREGKGREQEGNGTLCAPDGAHAARFEQFWSVYPRKVGKGAARAIWMRLRPDEAFTRTLLSAVERQSLTQQWKRDGGSYIPHPKTWLSQSRWEDEVDAPVTRKPAPELVPYVSPRQQYYDEHGSQGPAGWKDECQALHGGHCSEAFYHAQKVDAKQAQKVAS